MSLKTPLVGSFGNFLGSLLDNFLGSPSENPLGTVLRNPSKNPLGSPLRNPLGTLFGNPSKGPVGLPCGSALEISEVMKDSNCLRELEICAGATTRVEICADVAMRKCNLCGRHR